LLLACPLGLAVEKNEELDDREEGIGCDEEA
jgi:hypothetical protein